MPQESYMHRYAKTVVAAWLRKKNRSKSKKMMTNVPCSFKGCSPFYNIYVEYPICQDSDGNIIGLSGKSNDIWGDYFENVLKKPRLGRMPSYKELTNNGLKVLQVFDVVSISDNKLQCIFEIQYKHPIDKNKIKFIKEHKVECYELSATQILDRTCPPITLEYLQHIT